MSNNEIKNPEDIRELSLEEMEDVTGGGMREIVAGVTLAAMTMTGGAAGAFGLANAIAEEHGAFIETAPMSAIEGPVGEVVFEIGDPTPPDVIDAAPMEVSDMALEAEVMDAADAQARDIQVGDTVTINTGTPENAGVWKKWDYLSAGKKANWSLPNGTRATLVKAATYHSGKGRNYAMIEFTYKGKACQGWVAASIIGLPR